MIIVGLTGGIGSGKTTVAKMFKDLGVPVYISDKEAKKLMRKSKKVKKAIIKLFGEDAYVDGDLNRPFIANLAFKNKEILQQLNAIVHPAVRKHFLKWTLKQDSKYIIQESALIFEGKNQKSYTKIITVVAPEAVRIDRVLQRDPNLSAAQVKNRIGNQMADELKIAHSHYVIHNLDLTKTKQEVKKIHSALLRLG